MSAAIEARDHRATSGLRLAGLTANGFVRRLVDTRQDEMWIALSTCRDNRAFALAADRTRRTRLAFIVGTAPQVLHLGAPTLLSALPSCSLRSWKLQAAARRGAMPIDAAFFDALDAVLRVW